MKTSLKAIVVGISGTALQWYDFSIFGYLTPLIAAEFFPTSSTAAAVLYTFVIFAVGFFLAPLGAILFGHIGDRHGRKRALILSILMMTIPTGLIAFLPSYHTIGICAPLLLTLLRVMQGLAASSEYIGSAIFLVEHAPAAHRSLFGSLTSSAYSVGLIVGSAVTAACTALIPAWGWRLAFLFSILGGVLVFYVRKHAIETPDFIQQAPHVSKHTPLVTAIKETRHTMLCLIGLAWFTGIITFGTYVYMPTYLLTYSHIPLPTAITIVTIGLMVDAMLEPLIASLADTVGRYKVMITGMISILLLSAPLFHCLHSGNLSEIIVAMISLSMLIAISYAPMNAFMVSLFPPRYRYSGFGVAFNVGISLFGGTAPLALGLLAHSYGTMTPWAYYSLAAFIGLMALLEFIQILTYSSRIAALIILLIDTAHAYGAGCLYQASDDRSHLLVRAASQFFPLRGEIFD